VDFTLPELEGFPCSQPVGKEYKQWELGMDTALQKGDQIKEYWH